VIFAVIHSTIRIYGCARVWRQRGGAAQEAARSHQRHCRLSGGVATRDARAATGAANNWISRSELGGELAAIRQGFRKTPARTRLDRGSTIAIEYRWAEGNADRYADIAAEFVKRKVNVIVTAASAVRAAMQATSTIPIVFAVAVEPLASGFVAAFRILAAM
jgi:hypothetical protein